MERQQRWKEVIKGIPGFAIVHSIRRILKTARFHFRGGRFYRQAQYSDALSSALHATNRKSDIFEHLNAIFYFAVDASPKLTVELGTRGGESTRALLAAASLTDSVVLSIDIADCGATELPFRSRWHFVKADDVEFGRSDFKEWCQRQLLEPVIDVLFVDTSHCYEHTKNEIAVWSRYLSPCGVMIFHDTNMGTGIFARHDGSVDVGWDNKRGVVRAIEEFLGRRYDENAFFCDMTDAYAVLHFPHSNGLTVVKKRGALTPRSGS
jgi:predicted O-methyltransferase YrrM